MKYLAPEQIVLVVWSSINAVLSGIVLITPGVFPNLQQQTFVQLMTWTALCTFMTSIGTFIGFPDDGSAACGVQSFVISFFVKASWFWLTLIAMELYWIFKFESLVLENLVNFFSKITGNTGANRMSSENMRHILRHFFVWSLSLILTLLPLSTSDFGRTDDGRDSAMCFISGSNTSKTVMAWSFASIYVPFFVCLILLLFFALQLYYSLKSTQSMGEILWGPIEWQMINLFLYPIYFITWLPFVVLSINDNFGGGSDDGGYNFAVDFGNILSTQLGTFVFLIFFITSYEARHRWFHLLFCPLWRVEHYDIKQPLLDECKSPLVNEWIDDPANPPRFHQTIVVEPDWCGQRSNRLTTVRNFFPLLFKYLGQFMPDALIQYKVEDDAPSPQNKPSSTKFMFP